MSILPKLQLLFRSRLETEEADDDVGGVVTGEGLVESILTAVKNEQSVLVTGPRGCGKTYCIEDALKRARNEGLILGHHFLQGNRELPRDYLSEDLVFVGATPGKPLDFVEAVALSPPAGSGLETETLASMRKRCTQCWNESVTTASGGIECMHHDGDRPFPRWPALPKTLPRGLNSSKLNWWVDYWDWRRVVAGDSKPREGQLRWALFLDEVNRFGDGLLDSLLSIVEEKIVVSRGQSYRVPLVVLASANPPGYDVTAKKLSPPLQARIVNSYRVCQPPLHVLVMLADETREFFGNESKAPDWDVLQKACLATLCLWGDPATADPRGAHYLTNDTRRLLVSMMKALPTVAEEMKQLSRLVLFGPDARAVRDWYRAARVSSGQGGKADPESLRRTCVQVLSHKVRANFNEGAEPAKLRQLERSLYRIVDQILSSAPSDRLVDWRTLFNRRKTNKATIGLAYSDALKLIEGMSYQRLVSWSKFMQAKEQEPGPRSANADKRNDWQIVVRPVKSPWRVPGRLRTEIKSSSAGLLTDHATVLVSVRGSDGILVEANVALHHSERSLLRLDANESTTQESTTQESTTQESTTQESTTQGIDIIAQTVAMTLCSPSQIDARVRIVEELISELSNGNLDNSLLDEISDVPPEWLREWDSCIRSVVEQGPLPNWSSSSTSHQLCEKMIAAINDIRKREFVA